MSPYIRRYDRFIWRQHIFSCVEKRRKRTIYIDSDIDKQMRVAAVEDDKFYGEYAEEAFRLFLDKRRKERKSVGTKS